jgi:hypothetical protein
VWASYESNNDLHEREAAAQAEEAEAAIEEEEVVTVNEPTVPKPARLQAKPRLKPKAKPPKKPGPKPKAKGKEKEKRVFLAEAEHLMLLRLCNFYAEVY